MQRINCNRKLRRKEKKVEKLERGMEDLLPPGFRFYPTEEELITFYLHNKLDPTTREDLNRLIDRVIPILDIYEKNPWDLPRFSGVLCHGDPEQWFFFIPRQESEARGGRPNRLTTSGYWKATGSPGYVYSSTNHRVIGVKRTMVFYNGRAPSGTKTDWKLNEYKAIDGDAASSSSTASNMVPKVRHEFSLCRIYKKSKSLRAFDRRPSMGMSHNPPVSMPSNQQLVQSEEREAGTSSSSLQYLIPPGPAAETAGAFDYSSSGDDNPPSQAGESHAEMAVNDEQVLLDNVGWFFAP